MAPYNFLTKIMNEEIIDRYGNDDENSITKRDYTYITDIISGIISTMTVNLQNKNEIYNLGNSNPIELNTLISTIEKVTHKSAIINQLPAQLGDVPITCADISKAQRDLNYYPKVNLETGIRNTYIHMNLEKNNIKFS